MNLADASATAAAFAGACACSAALAQDARSPADAAAPARLEPVIVTGSHIPRIDAETALPVQVITREDIERSGVTTPAQLLDRVPGNVNGFNDTASIQQAGVPGMSTANLRGLGDGATLVLLNGRRLANYAYYGAAVDINSIPLSAVERVEILKDGASAIYGSDAIAGVINFVLRKDYAGAQLDVQGSATQHGGGNTWLAVATAGIGDIAVDRYNVFVSASFQKNESLSSAERDFARAGYRPDLGINRLSPLSFPANILDTRRRLELSPVHAQGCTPPTTLPLPPAACGYDTQPHTDLLPAVERTGLLTRGTWRASDATELFADVLLSRNVMDKDIGPSPILPNTPSGTLQYPAGGPYYPADFAAANGLSGDLTLLYRAAELGPRVNIVDSRAQRYVLGAEGQLALARHRWDYNVAAIYSRNTQSDEYGSGYVYASRLVPAMRSGLINPFGPSDAAGRALLESTLYHGTPHTSEASTSALNAFASGEIAALPAGPLTLALGAEARRERLQNDWDPALLSGDPALGSIPMSVGGSRTAYALFAELAVPLATGLDAQLALRMDDYSDFGSTTNPKVALLWQPAPAWLVRASWGTGFRAPPLYDLYRPASSQVPLMNVADPVRCPVTGEAADCRATVDFTFSGNPDLQPETSTQWNGGVVWQPARDLAIGVDYWSIEIEDRIVQLNPGIALRFYGQFSDHFIRGPVDPRYPALPGPLTGVSMSPVNFGHTETRGFDVSVDWTAPRADWGTLQLVLQGTYVTRWTTLIDGVNTVSMVGTNTYNGVIPRWRSLLTLNWTRGSWGATLSQSYTRGYVDAQLDPAGHERRVDAFAPWDLQVTYTASTNWRFAAGVRNLLDADPPVSNQSAAFQLGYDPRLASPLGRLFYLRASYALQRP